MSVVNVLEKVSKATLNFSGKQSTASRAFSVLCDSASEAEQTIRTAPLIPAAGTSWPGLPGLVCKSHTVRRDGSPYLWEVTANYQASGSKLEAYNDPMAEAVQIDWSFSTSEQAVDTTPDEQPIWNTVHERFDPPIKARRAVLVGRLSRNELVFDAMRAATFVNTVNSRSFLGLPAKTAIIIGISGSTKSTPNLDFWRVTYEVHFNTGTWRSRVANLGTRLKVVDAAGKVVGYETIKDVEGNRIGKPVPISLDGTKRIDPDKQPVEWLYFDVYAESNFALLGLE